MDRRCTDRLDVPSALLLDVVELLTALSDECSGIGELDSDDSGIEIEIEGGFLLILGKPCTDHLLDGIGVLHHRRGVGTYVDPLLETGGKELGDVSVLGELVEILRIDDKSRTLEFNGGHIQSGWDDPTDLLTNVTDTVVSSHNINLMKLNGEEKGV